MASSLAAIWRTPRSRGAIACALSVALFSAACGDNTVTGIATSENFTRTFSLYALSGSPSGYPAAYDFTGANLVRPQILNGLTVNFELAFDIGTDGRVLLLPARTVVTQALAVAPSIGLQKSSVPFVSLTKAPQDGFTRDSVFTGAAGDTFLVQLLSTCAFDPLYGKFAIDSVIPSERRIVVTALVNRNCGFRGLVVGLPTE